MQRKGLKCYGAVAGPNDELTFKLDVNDAVMKCSTSESFTSLKIGDVVTVPYFDPAVGSYIANEINFGAAALSIILS